MFKKKILLFLLVLILGSFDPLKSSQELFLRDSLLEAKAGHYVVILQGKTLSLLHIFERQAHGLIMEEISAPIKIKSSIQGNWQQWLNQKAPGHTSWIMYELNFENHPIEEVYSCTQKSWKKVFAQEQVFSTLIDLKFTPIEPSKRKRVGPPLSDDQIDNRPLWQPPIVYEGEKVKGALCEAYSSHWPNDGTDLAGKKIEIFLVQGPSNLPHYFPIWMQVSDKVGHSKLRVIDSGSGLISPNKEFPIPPPEVVACHYTQEGNLQFQIRAHASFESFVVYGREFDSPSCFALPSTQQISQNLKQRIITINNEDLNHKLELNKSYVFIFEPATYPQLSIETPKPLKLLKKYATK